MRKSKEALDWLNFVAFRDSLHIQHVNNGGEKRVCGRKVDDFCAERNTVYEYHGWQKCFKPHTKNHVNDNDDLSLRRHLAKEKDDRGSRKNKKTGGRQPHPYIGGFYTSTGSNSQEVRLPLQDGIFLTDRTMLRPWKRGLSLTVSQWEALNSAAVYASVMDLCFPGLPTTTTQEPRMFAIGSMRYVLVVVEMMQGEPSTGLYQYEGSGQDGWGDNSVQYYAEPLRERNESESPSEARDSVMEDSSESASDMSEDSDSVVEDSSESASDMSEDSDSVMEDSSESPSDMSEDSAIVVEDSSESPSNMSEDSDSVVEDSSESPSDMSEDSDSVMEDSSESSSDMSEDSDSVVEDSSESASDMSEDSDSVVEDSSESASDMSEDSDSVVEDSSESPSDMSEDSDSVVEDSSESPSDMSEDSDSVVEDSSESPSDMSEDSDSVVEDSSESASDMSEDSDSVVEDSSESPSDMSEDSDSVVEDSSESASNMSEASDSVMEDSSESASEDSASVMEVYVKPPASPELIDITSSPPPSPSSTRATTYSPPAYEYTPRSPSTSPPPRYNTGTTCPPAPHHVTSQSGFPRQPPGRAHTHVAPSLQVTVVHHALYMHYTALRCLLGGRPVSLSNWEGKEIKPGQLVAVCFSAPRRFHVGKVLKSDIEEQEVQVQFYKPERKNLLVNFGAPEWVTPKFVLDTSVDLSKDGVTLLPPSKSEEERLKEKAKRFWSAESK
ncbi:hypothetical protein Bbelb_035790 [Branchiostoma belcheri]|nr:hypothetical protein Bbelb_035790 [Branchiostoma belcheri]